MTTNAPRPASALRLHWLLLAALLALQAPAAVAFTTPRGTGGAGGVLSEGEPVWVTEPVEAAGVRFKKFRSAAVGGDVSYHIYLPPGYDKQRDRRYPVIYWLHGLGSGTKGVPFLARYFAEAMQSGDMPPAIVVFPNGLPAGMWVDSRDGTAPVESMLVRDLIPHIDRTYRTQPMRDGRIIEGFSMGGYGAGRLGLKYPQLFGAFSMMGAGPLQQNFLEDDPDLQPLPMRQVLFERVYGGDMNYFRSQSPWSLASAAKGRDQRIRIIIGEEDRSKKNNEAFHRHLQSLGIPHEYIEVAGVAHDPLGTLEGSRQSAMEFYADVLPGGGS